MATRFEAILKSRGEHSVGNINSWEIETFANGAVCAEDIDNFRLVEVGYSAEGEATCTYLKDAATRGLLICSPETRHFEFEEMCDFYNGKEERARLTYLTEGKRFQTSAFAMNAGVTEIKAGMVAHFDPATKKFIISKADAAHAAFATAGNQFVVYHQETDMEFSIDDQTLVTLLVTK